MRGTHTHTCIYTSLQISITWYTQDAFKNIYIVNDNQNNNAKSSYFIVATGFNNMLKLKTFCTPQIISFLFLFSFSGYEMQCGLVWRPNRKRARSPLQHTRTSHSLERESPLMERIKRATDHEVFIQDILIVETKQQNMLLINTK